MMSRRTMCFRQKTGNGVRGLRGAVLLIAALGAGLFLAGLWNAACASAADKTRDLPLLERWSGDYPVVRLNRLPENQRALSTGFLGNAGAFSAVWQAFKPDVETPVIDFKTFVVLFSRNVDFYNKKSIVKVSLEDGVIEVFAVETMSAMPIEDKVAMAMVVIPREGVKFLKAGRQIIPLAEAGSAAGPLNTTYEIGAESVALVNGRAETATAPGSASRMETRVFGQPVCGDLDGDGDEDAALLLLQDFGASGTFYYVAAARKVSGAYAGTNAVLLGDRIAPQNVAITNGVVVANYAVRGSQEPMTARPSLHVSKYLTLEKEVLVEIEPVGKGEQVLHGWVTIGHEVRSFRPCSDVRTLWISGQSPALKEIKAALREAYPDPHQDNRLFMVLAGRHAPRPTQGFGAEYESAFYATCLVKVWPKGTCTPDR